MFSYSLRIDERRNRAVYGPGLPFRFVCIFFALLLLYGAIWTMVEEGFSTLLLAPCGIILVLLLSAMYRDEWLFDNGKREACVIFGLGPLVSRRKLTYRRIARFEVTHFLKGIPDGSDIATKPSWRHPSQIVLSVVLDDADSTRLDIEITGERRNGTKLEREASRLSAFTGLGLRMDRESCNTRHL